jgi:nucleolar MIF4G domain-containing protein 1
MVEETKNISRKDRRREERVRKKQKRRPPPVPSELLEEAHVEPVVVASKDKKKRKGKVQDLPERKLAKQNDAYGHLESGVAAALRRDDEEIAALEAKLKLSSKADKSRLNKEYAKLEGYGDDFGDFLDDLDGIMQRVTHGEDFADEGDLESDVRIRNDVKTIETNKSQNRAKAKTAVYSNLDSHVAAALRRDDEEIADLEAKLGLGNKKEKSRLKKEYAKLEGYGDDFIDFLDDLDNLTDRLVKQSTKEDSDDDNDTSPDDDGQSESEGEEIIPMKEPAFNDLDEDDSVMDSLESTQSSDSSDHEALEDDMTRDRSESQENLQSDDMDIEQDHEPEHTYRPSAGENIYGKEIGAAENMEKPRKYVPPHLRNTQEVEGKEDSAARQDALREIQRSLNNALNRLSDDALISVAQSICQLYPMHPTSDVNTMIWNNLQNACIARSHLMTGLIPAYVAAITGVHIEKGDTAQLGEFLIEKTVLEIWKKLEVIRSVNSQNDSPLGEESLTVNKETSNLILVLCYLYNFGVVHCSLIYDAIRNLIESFTEIDVELLLLILSHSGRALRSDDPLALKEIVFLVQKQYTIAKKSNTNASRLEYMVSAVIDLKNNRKRKQDALLEEKTTKLRKLLGQIKSKVAQNNVGYKASDSSLRIGLRDIFNAETKGRWWKVGASWVGHLVGEKSSESPNQGTTNEVKPSIEDEKLLRLASKHRMNSDTRRSIFCIIMSSADCEDCFEKLVRAGMLKNRVERDTVRVLIECCGNEKAYNKFYSHLGARICEYQSSCKFTIQLAFWDVFKQFDDMSVRKAANLAKLLFSLIVDHHILKLNVLKAIDISSPDELSETALVFTTVLLSSIMEKFDDPSQVQQLFETGISHKKAIASDSVDNIDGFGEADESEALRANLTIFFMQVLKGSPRYKKGSRYRANLKAAIKSCDVDEFF